MTYTPRAKNTFSYARATPACACANEWYPFIFLTLPCETCYDSMVSTSSCQQYSIVIFHSLLAKSASAKHYYYNVNCQYTALIVSFKDAHPFLKGDHQVSFLALQHCVTTKLGVAIDLEAAELDVRGAAFNARDVAL